MDHEVGAGLRENKVAISLEVVFGRSVERMDVRIADAGGGGTDRRCAAGTALCKKDGGAWRRYGRRRGPKAEVVGLARKACRRTLGRGRASVDNPRPGDDGRSAVEVGLVTATATEDVELGVRPKLRQIDDVVVIHNGSARKLGASVK